MPLDIKFDQGLNTAADAQELQSGELVTATGIYYKPGDARAHKIGGVTTYGDTGSGARVDGVAVLGFDESDDKLVALSGGTLYGSDISSQGATGTFSSLQAGLGSAASTLSAAQFNDRWYVAVGTGTYVLEDDDTVRTAGMSAPTAMSYSSAGTSAASTATRAASASGATYTNVAQAYDSDTATYASLRSNSAATSVTTFKWSGTSDTGTGRDLRVKWALGASSFTDEMNYEYSYDDVGGTSTAGFSVNIKMELSEDNGTSWTTILDEQGVNRTKATGVLSVPVTDSLELDGNLLLRVTKQYVSGTNYADLRLYDLSVQAGGEAADFSTSTGCWYVLTEYDADRGVESPGAPVDSIVTLSSQNSATFTLPSAATNSTATHWRIYRGTDGGGKQADLGLIGQVPISDTSYTDDFAVAKDTIAYPQYPWLVVTAQQDTAGSSKQYYDQNNPPPALATVRAYNGSLVGLSKDSPRSLFYSMAGRPEAWPKINVIDSFPVEEYDTLVDCVALGTMLLVAATGTMFRVMGLPRAVNGVRDSSSVEQLRGAPGCVGRYALATFSVFGEPRAAWISPYGVYQTNGDTVQRISDNIEWSKYDGVDKSKWGLHWDARRLCLVLSTGESDGFYYLLHMAPEHQRASGRGPKWTGPHYGAFVAHDSAQVASTHRLYAGHRSDGVVYVMDRGGTDSSGAYSGTTVPLVVQTGELYAAKGDSDWAALDAVLHHTNFGGGETCTLDWTVDNDHETGSRFTKSQSVALAGTKGTQLDIAERCQWAQAKITHTGTGAGSLLSLRVRTVRRGHGGNKRIA